jgi:hypothetical protein
MVIGELLTTWVKPETTAQWKISINRNSEENLRLGASLKIRFPSFRLALEGLYRPYLTQARVIAVIDIPKKLV